MLKTSTRGLLLATMMLSGLLVSSADAANWHTNGVKALNSTNAGSVRMVIHPASGSQVILQCPTSSLSGTLNGPTSAALPWLSAATVTPVFGAAGNCVVPTPGFTVACSSAELRANSYAGGDTLATAGGGVTTGAITGIDCRLSAGATQCSTLTGSVPVHYTNPNPIATGAGSFTLTTAGQSLTLSKIGAGCAAIPHGTVTLGNPNGAGVGHLTFVVDGPAAPYLYRGT